MMSEMGICNGTKVPRVCFWQFGVLFKYFRCLREQGVPEKCVRLVKNTYDDARSQVKTSIGVTGR